MKDLYVARAHFGEKIFARASGVSVLCEGTAESLFNEIIRFDRNMHTRLEAQGSNTELKPGVYLHYKGAKYLVYEVGTHTETNERLVVYRPLYGSYGLSIRPLSMFLENVPPKSSSAGDAPIPRFRFLGDAGSGDLATDPELIQNPEET